jgi:small multidrug resistance pump
MTSAFNAYAALALAIVLEVTASAFLQQSAVADTGDGAVLCRLVLRAVGRDPGHPLSIAYAIWGGIGIILTATVSFVLFRQMLDAAAFVGIALIVSGVVVINLFSATTVH